MMMTRLILESALILMLGSSVFGAECPGGENSVKKFRVFEDKLNWYGALLNCSAEGMSLATITSQEEKNELAGQLEALRPKDIDIMGWWIGGADLHVKKEFVWFSTGEPMTYRYFRRGEPSSAYTANGERCVEILFGVDWDYEWNDNQCTTDRPFICEYFEETVNQ